MGGGRSRGDGGRWAEVGEGEGDPLKWEIQRGAGRWGRFLGGEGESRREVASRILGR